MNSYSASGEPESLYAPATPNERRLDYPQQHQHQQQQQQPQPQSPLSSSWEYTQTGPRAYYSQTLPPILHQVTAPTSGGSIAPHHALRSMSSGDHEGNYTWHATPSSSSSHLHPHPMYSLQDFHQHHHTASPYNQHHHHHPSHESADPAVTPPPEVQYVSAHTISPQRISPAPHSAPVMVPSSRDVRTPSPPPPPHGPADLLDEVAQAAAYPPHHYQSRDLSHRSQAVTPPPASAPAGDRSPKLAAMAHQLGVAAAAAAESVLTSEDTSMRCTDFVAKLWFLLDRPEYRPHIRWNESGESFIFFPTTAFATDVLARLFKHSNVASFVRQLNLYGFQRISHLELLEDLSPSDHNGADEADSTIPASGFSHPDFVRGQPQSLGKIRPKPSPSRARKTSGKRKARAEDDEDELSTQNAPARRRRH